MVLTTCYPLVLLHGKQENISNDQITIDEEGREAFLFGEVLVSRRRPVVRGLQRDDLREASARRVLSMERPRKK